MKNILGLLIFITVLKVHGQQDEMKKLDFLIGNWEITAFEKNEDNNWEVGNPSISKFSHVLGNRFIQEQAIFRGKNMTMTTLIYTGYDSRLKKYKTTVMDQEFGIMDTYLGNFINDNQLQLDNLEDAQFETSQGEKLAFQLNWTFADNDNLVLIVKMSKDGGENWIDFNKVIYTRLN